MLKNTKSKPATPSVMARLMDLDELQSQQTVNKPKKQRVLSENYLRKVASIGTWDKKRSFDKRSSFWLSKEQREFKDAFEVIESLERDKWSDSFVGKGRVDLRSSRGRISHDSTTDRRTPKLLRKLENDFVKDSQSKYGHDSTSMVPRLHLEPNEQTCPASRKIVILKRKPGEAETDKKDEGENFIKSQSQAYSTSFGSPYITLRPMFPWSRRKSIMQVSSQKDCLKQRNSGSNCKQSRSSPERESEKNYLLEQNSIVSKSLKHGTVREMSAEDCLVPDSSMFSSASLSIVSEQFESTGCTMSENDRDSSSCITDAWSQQEDGSSKASEECSTDPEFLVNLETANQPSPVSVLEAPFAEGNLLSSKCFFSVTASLNDVKRQLEFLKSESIEEYKEGPGMVVSSEDENDCEVNENSTKLFAVAESRDLAYLVDVLTETGFDNINPDILFNEWTSLETPISPSVFETLEKKYSKQISWKRSERRLLFDQINSGLIEILQPCLGDPMWTKPVARRLSYSKNSKEIKEELYKLLVRQENEAKKKSSEKVFGKDDGWLSLGYEIEVIGREIENSLIDELAAEIVSL